MLCKLLIENYVFIDSSEIDFPAGLIIMTGKTGAGKSVMMGALNLLTGAKSDPGMIGDKSSNCVVEGVFDVTGLPHVRKILESNDLEYDNCLMIRRVLSPSGRSRAFINDSPVPLTLLAELSSYLLDIHEQNRTMMLTDKKYQLSLIDSFSGNTRNLEEYSALRREYKSKEKRLKLVEEEIERSEKEKDYNDSALEKLTEAALIDGELEELEAEYRKLSNAGEIKEALYKAGNLISSDEHPLSCNLKEAEKNLDKIQSYVPECGQLVERLESLRYELEDVLQEIETRQNSVEFLPEEAEKIESRISLIYFLQKKHGVTSVSELIDIKKHLEQSSDTLQDLYSEKNRLTAELDKLLPALMEKSSLMRKIRKQGAKKFASEIVCLLNKLELGGASFDVEFEEIPLSDTGSDAVCFKFSSSGKNLVDAAKCASGGEKSRIMLSIKAIMSSIVKMPCLFFDEIDSGVSGSAADKMGELICEMGRNMQIFAITHIPQVAAKGSVHFTVSKELSGARPRTVIEKKEGEERVMEIARLLSGSHITPEAVANAKSLLSN